MFHHVLLGGDQLTVQRATGSKKERNNEDRGIDRLEGLIPVVEDWHTKVVVLKVITIHTIFLISLILIGHLEASLQNLLWNGWWHSLPIKKSFNVQKCHQ